MKKMRFLIVGFILAAFTIGLCGGCATTGDGQSPSQATGGQPSAKEWVDKQGSGANLPPWENQ
jgi:hypothetical protein